MGIELFFYFRLALIAVGAIMFFRGYELTDTQEEKGQNLMGFGIAIFAAGLGWILFDPAPLSANGSIHPWQPY